MVSIRSIVFIIFFSTFNPSSFNPYWQIFPNMPAVSPTSSSILSSKTGGCQVECYIIKGLAKLRFAPFCSLRGRSHYRLNIQVLHSILLILFFWIFRLRIYTLYVIFTSYGLYPWKSSSRSPIKIFSPQSHFTIWVLSRVYVIYGENSLWFYGPLLVLFKLVYVDFQIDHLEKPPNLYFYKSIFLASSVA